MDYLEGSALLPSINEAINMLIKKWMVKIIEVGIRHQELTQSLQPYDTAIYIVSTLEGVLVLTD